MIWLPYSVMAYKLTEFYALSVPMFVPSPKFYLKNDGLGDDRVLNDHLHCIKFSPDAEKKVRPKMESGFSSHIYSPSLVLVRTLKSAQVNFCGHCKI